MNFYSHKGFTMIELMFVISIIAILSAIAIPTYHNYTLRTKVAEGIILASAAKIAVIEAYASTAHTSLAAYSGSGPALTNSYVYSYTPSTLVTSISIAAISNTLAPSLPEGRITITYGGQLSKILGSPLLLTPGSGTLQDGKPSIPININMPIIWGCTINSVNAFRYVPANCRFLP